MIAYSKERQIFLLSTVNTSYAIIVTKHGYLKHLHWGGKINSIDDFDLIPEYYIERKIVGIDDEPNAVIPIKKLEKETFFERLDEEYSGWGGYFFGDPGIKVDFEDGVRDLLLIYSSHEITESTDTSVLRIRMKDNIYDLFVDLYYKIYHDLDVIDRWVCVVNKTEHKVTIEQIMSAMWHFPRGDQYRLTHMYGKWSGEFQLAEVMLTQSSVTMETRTGVSGHHSCPWFALDWQAEAQEESGDIYAGTLHWSGNWRITAQKDNHERVRVTGGIHDFDFAWPLLPDEEFSTPIFTGVYSTGGFGGASRQLHKYMKLFVLPPYSLEKIPSIAYSTWGLYTFNSDEEQELEIVPHAAQMGVDLYHVDDCWFSTRDNDYQGLGDWYCSPTKFPNGLGELIDSVKKHGMEFGLWVEPEMVSQDTHLFRDHPDWIIHFPGKQMTTGRNQHVLNFGMKEVQEWAIKWLTELLEQYDIDFFKWDMNRYISEPGWSQLKNYEQKTIWVKYVQGVYRVFRTIKEKFPKVYLMNCASGGGRVDMGLMKYCDTAALSDCGDMWDYIKIYWGYTYAFAPMSTGYPRVTRMWGEPDIRSKLSGWSSDPREYSPEEKSLMKKRNDDFRKVRHIIHQGELYRLSSPYKDEYVAMEYVLEDMSEALIAVIGLKQTYQRFLPKLRLCALDPDSTYEINGHPPMTGRGLMAHGLDVTFREELDSYYIHLKKLQNS